MTAFTEEDERAYLELVYQSKKPLPRNFGQRQQDAAQMNLKVQEMFDQEHKRADLIIARCISSKPKGWAYRHREPINFADPGETPALIQWASRQPFWNTQAVGPWTKNVAATWSEVYTNICLNLSENRLTTAEYARYVRDMVACAINR